MYEIEEKTKIEAPLEKVWERVKRVDRWWAAGGPGKEVEVKKGASLELADEMTGGAYDMGEISDFLDMQKVAWEAKNAKYRFMLLLSVNVDKGVVWTINPGEGKTELNARLWVKFPDSSMGRLAEWSANSIKNFEEKDRDRARRALAAVKKQVEA